MLTACSQPRGIKPGDTQVVAQWVLDDSDGGKGSFANALSEISHMFERMTLEAKVDAACKEVCFLDGNDIGGGTYNLYLYTQDVRSTVKLLVDLEDAHRIPPNLRIGVARYADREHKNWTYDPVYPQGLQSFDISYSLNRK